MKYDLIVFGATSFVGKILCRYLLSQTALSEKTVPKKKLQWAMAARSASKLAEFKAELNDEGLTAEHIDTLVADASDESALLNMCHQTKVVISTVGPYALYGEPLVRICALSGTDYCDLTGETPWVERMIRTYEKQAEKSGARIVNCCGFDSIPSDLGVWHLQSESRKKFGQYCNQISMRVKVMKGGASGGTVASLINVVKEAASDSQLRRQLSNPYSLCAEDFRFKTKQKNHMVASYDKRANTWIAPFVMAGVNTRVVFRSHAILDAAYGEKFTYDEAMMMGQGIAGGLRASQFAAGLGGFVLASAIKPSRWIVEKLLPKPGEGPTREAQEKGFFDLRFYGTTTSGETITTKVTGDRDPGYGSTGKMLGEAALCLAFDSPKKEIPGGFWTPSTIFGQGLIDRLQANAGLRFSII